MHARGFQVEIDSHQVNSSCAAGSVAGTEPDGSTIEDGYVLLKISNGHAPGPPTPNPGQPGGPGRPPGNRR